VFLLVTRSRPHLLLISPPPSSLPLFFPKQRAMHSLRFFRQRFFRVFEDYALPGTPNRYGLLHCLTPGIFSFFTERRDFEADPNCFPNYDMGCKLRFPAFLYPLASPSPLPCGRSASLLFLVSTVSCQCSAPVVRDPESRVLTRFLLPTSALKIIHFVVREAGALPSLFEGLIS